MALVIGCWLRRSTIACASPTRQIAISAQIAISGPRQCATSTPLQIAISAPRPVPVQGLLRMRVGAPQPLISVLRPTGTSTRRAAGAMASVTRLTRLSQPTQLTPQRPAAASARTLPDPHQCLSPHRCVSTSAPSASSACIEAVYAALEEARGSTKEQFDVRLEEGRLELNLGPKGVYSLEELQGGRVRLFSPVSGPYEYEYDPHNEWWANPKDGHLLYELLVRELMHITAVCINL